MMTMPRPALRWLGGKYRLARWIVGHFPKHAVYVETHGGAASVLLEKERVRTEVYNDLDDELVNFFRVLRDPVQAGALTTLLRLTPFSRTEFFAAYGPSDEPVERARRLVVRSFMGFGSCAARADRSTGFRTGARKGDAPASREWATYPDALPTIIERFAGVSIEQLPASRLFDGRDDEETLFYVDPPYVHSTRSPKRTRTAPSNGYTHEMSDADHADLIDHVRGLRGMVVLSGYASDIYDHALTTWLRVERSTMADGARPRTEVLWINPRAASRLSESNSHRRRP